MILNRHVFVLACFLITFAACNRSKTEVNTERPKSGVQVYVAGLKDYSSDISSFGSIVYTRKNDITTAVEGTIARLDLREGNEIRAGQRIAVLSNIQLMIRRDQTYASVRSAEASTKLVESQYQDYRRQMESRFLSLEKMDIEIEKKKRLLEYMDSDFKDKQQLFDLGGLAEETMRSTVFQIANEKADLEILEKEAGISRIGMRDSDLVNAGYRIPQDPQQKRELLVDLNSRTKLAELEVAKAQLASVKTELSSIEALIDELNLVSPITGIIGAIYKEAGERAEAGEKIMTVFDSSDAWVVFPVNEDELYRIRQGMEAEIIIDALQQSVFTATVDIISPTVDPQSGNVSIKALIKDLNNLGKPGMFARVTVKTGDPEKKILLPLSSLAQRQGDEGTVLSVRDNRIFQRKVSLGLEHKGEIEIVSGINEGEMIVREPSPLLREGDEVVIYD